MPADCTRHSRLRAEHSRMFYRQRNVPMWKNQMDNIPVPTAKSSRGLCWAMRALAEGYSNLIVKLSEIYPEVQRICAAGSASPVIPGSSIRPSNHLSRNRHYRNRIILHICRNTSNSFRSVTVFVVKAAPNPDWPNLRSNCTTMCAPPLEYILRNVWAPPDRPKPKLPRPLFWRNRCRNTIPVCRVGRRWIVA